MIPDYWAVVGVALIIVGLMLRRIIKQVQALEARIRTNRERIRRMEEGEL